MTELGERVAALDARFEQFEKYEHERWHKLANDLQPLVNLPVQIARDMGKLEGQFNGQVSAIMLTLDRTVADAVARAIQPVSDDVAALKGEVDALKNDRAQLSGARMLGVFILQTLIAAASAIAALIAIGRGG